MPKRSPQEPPRFAFGSASLLTQREFQPLISNDLLPIRQADVWFPTCFYDRGGRCEEFRHRVTDQLPSS